MKTKRIAVQDYCEITYLESDFHEVNAKIPRGKITEEVEIAFTQGQCHALALVLHRRTGWKLAGLYSYWALPDHVVVMHPDGTGVDIRGLGAECHPRNRRKELRPLTEEEILTFSDDFHKKYAGTYFLEPNLAVAEEYADLVLQKVEKQRQTNTVPVCQREGNENQWMKT